MENYKEGDVAVPPRSLGGRFMKSLKEKQVRYSVFVIILLELFSLSISHTSYYTTYIYDLLIQLISFLWIVTMLNRPIKLKLCKRKRLAFKCLGLYYALGFMSIIFKVPANEYLYASSFILLGVSLVLMIITFKDE